MIAIKIAFWLSVALLCYGGVVFPAALRYFAWRSKASRQPPRSPREALPTVSLVIAAYNEQESIGSKLKNTLALDYPRNLREVIVVSDGSTDLTDELVRGFSDCGVRLLRVEGRKGKSLAVNAAVEQTAGEIVIFSDATGHWNASAVRNLVRNFEDPAVGCVSGTVSYESPVKGANAEGFGVFQRVSRSIRRGEQSIGWSVNASGSIHAVRKAAFRPVPADTFSDMVDPFHAAQMGLRTAFEFEAISLEPPRKTFDEEYRARVRIALGSWAFLRYALRDLPVRRAPVYCVNLLSQKVIRWLSGPLLVFIGVLGAVLELHEPIYGLSLWSLGGGITLAGMGLLSERMGRRVQVLSALTFFALTAAAYVVALVRYATGTRAVTWNPERPDGNPRCGVEKGVPEGTGSRTAADCAGRTEA